MLNSEAHSFCTGCGACVQKCNFKALSLKQDNQGYYVAHFDSSLCVGCNQCENICPVISNSCSSFCRNKTPLLYAVQMDNEIRQVSSSGGFFSAVATYVLEQNGVVFGAAWNDDLSVYHRAIENIAELDILRRSKYVQSYVGNSFQLVKKILKQKRKVLFTGTPCQIAGLNAFLGKDDNNLITIDLLCLCAPSQRYLKSYD